MENEKLLQYFRTPVSDAKANTNGKQHTHTDTRTHRQHKSLKSMEKYFDV